MAERLPRRRIPLPLTLVPQGREVARQGEPCREPLIIHRGALIAETISSEGQCLALDVLGPGDLIGGPLGTKSPCSVRALRTSSLRQATGDLAELEAHRAMRMTALAYDLAWLEVTQRIEHRLVDLAVRFGHPVPGGVALTLPLTQEHIAALAGTSRETANRSIRALIRIGRVSVRRRHLYVVHPRVRAATT